MTIIQKSSTNVKQIRLAHASGEYALKTLKRQSQVLQHSVQKVPQESTVLTQISQSLLFCINFKWWSKTTSILWICSLVLSRLTHQTAVHQKTLALSVLCLRRRVQEQVSRMWILTEILGNVLRWVFFNFQREPHAWNASNIPPLTKETHAKPFNTTQAFAVPGQRQISWAVLLLSHTMAESSETLS